MAKEPAEVKAAVSVRSKRVRRWFIGVSSVVILLLAAVAGYSFYYSQRILPHTVAGGVAVGGLTRAQAQAKLQQRQDTFLQNALTLEYEGKTWQIKPSDLGVTFHTDDALITAYSLGKNGSFLQQIEEQLAAVYTDHSVAMDVSSPTAAGLTALHDQVLKDIEKSTGETGLSLIPGHVSVVPGEDGLKLDENQFETDLAAAFKDDTSSISLTLVSFKPQVTPAQAESERAFADQLLASPWQIQAGDQRLTVEPKDIAGWLTTAVAKDAAGVPTGLSLAIQADPLNKYLTDTVAAKVQHPASNAVLKVDNGSVVIDKSSQDGQQLDLSQTATAIRTAMLDHAAATPLRSIVASVKTLPATLTDTNLQDLGVKEQIGAATTDFSGSPANRVFNITLGQSRMNGGLVQDGQTYSTLGSIGAIDEASGFKDELVILGNRTTPAAGGGLCQVSTTLFRAVLNAGLPVTQRANHSYQVSYYQKGVGPGLDATIYDPSPDFKWKNDTGHAVYIQSYVVGNKITFELYGTKDGRTSTVSAPATSNPTPSGDAIYINTDTLSKGTTKQVETAHDGITAVVEYSVMKDGKEVNHQTFHSVYRPWPAQYLVGTKE